MLDNLRSETHVPDQKPADTKDVARIRKFHREAFDQTEKLIDVINQVQLSAGDGKEPAMGLVVDMMAQLIAAQGAYKTCQGAIKDLGFEVLGKPKE